MTVPSAPRPASLVLTGAVGLGVAALGATGGFGPALLTIVPAVVAVALVVWKLPWRGFPLGLAAFAATLVAVGPTPFGTGVVVAATPLMGLLAVLSLDPPRFAKGLLAVGALVAGPAHALFYDPIRDVTCHGCGSSSFALVPNLIVAAGLRGVAVLLLVAACVVAARAVPPVPVLLLGVLALLLIVRTGLPEGGVAGLALAIATGLGVADGIRDLAMRRTLGRLARAVSGEPDAADDAPAAGDSIGRVAREARRVSAELERTVQDLTLARTATIERSDQERRLLERDLHDGAQQHLLALGFDLRRAAVQAKGGRAAELAASIDQIGIALERLREIAHGVYPPLLDSAGLRSALTSLARRHSLRVGDVPAGADPAVERLAYLVVDAAVASGGQVDVSGDLDHGRYRLIVRPAFDPSPMVRERARAAGGELRVNGDDLVLEVPCV